ncbi:hypothetical protein KCU85_g423, partial [Aureobasidium melanogenum]
MIPDSDSEGTTVDSRACFCNGTGIAAELRLGARVSLCGLSDCLCRHQVPVFVAQSLTSVLEQLATCHLPSESPMTADRSPPFFTGLKGSFVGVRA